jgi:hypothetical protein
MKLHYIWCKTENRYVEIWGDGVPTSCPHGLTHEVAVELSLKKALFDKLSQSSSSSYSSPPSDSKGWDSSESQETDKIGMVVDKQVSKLVLTRGVDGDSIDSTYSGFKGYKNHPVCGEDTHEFKTHRVLTKKMCVEPGDSSDHSFGYVIPLKVLSYVSSNSGKSLVSVSTKYIVKDSEYSGGRVWIPGRCKTKITRVDLGKSDIYLKNLPVDTVDYEGSHNKKPYTIITFRKSLRQYIPFNLYVYREVTNGNCNICDGLYVCRDSKINIHTENNSSKRTLVTVNLTIMC